MSLPISANEKAAAPPTWVVRTVFAVAALPPLLIAALIWRRGENMPFFDQWFDGNSVDIALKTADGSLRWTDLLVQNFEHRYFFSNLLTVLLTKLTDWNIRAEMMCSVYLALGTALMFIRILRAQAERTWPYAVVPLFAVLFSLRQQNNWLWSFQTGWFFILFFLACALWAVSRRPLGYSSLAAGGVACLCASFSFGSGLMTWPLVGFAAWLGGYRYKQYMFMWLAMMAAGLWLFFHNYQWMPHPSVVLSLSLIGNLLLFILAFIAMPLLGEGVPSPALALIGGALILFLFLLAALPLARAKKWAELAPWLALAGFPLGAAILVGTSFRGSDWRVALPGRFSTQAQLFAIAAIGVTTVKAAVLPARTSLVRTLGWLSFAVLFLLASKKSWVKPPFLAPPASVECALREPQTHDLSCLGILTDRPVSVGERLDRLAFHHLTAFGTHRAADAVPPPEPTRRFVFPTQLSKGWAMNSLQPIAGQPGHFHAGRDPQLYTVEPIDVPLKGFDQFDIDLAVDDSVKNRDVQLFYTLEADEGFSEASSFHLPLPEGSGIHHLVMYLGWMRLPPNAHLRKVRLDPVPDGDGDSLVIIERFELACIRPGCE